MLSNLNHYIQRVKSTHDDDSIDRLNYVTTIYMLLGFALTLFAKNYVGEPMQCWVPNQWTAVWEVFSESYCFVENTYFVPMNQSNLPAAHTREGREMIYYQWVPFILSLMALFFYIPRGVWNIFSSYSGLALADLMTAARKSAKTGADDPFIPSIASTLRKVHTSKVTRYGSNLFNLYVMMKILIFANLVLQFFYLNHFLGTEYTFWGAGIALDMLRGRQWQQSGHFPRVAFCDLTVREMGNVNNWTVQCVLMVNMFNEKIFIFLWFWFAMLLFCTSINLFVWIRRRYSKTARKTFLYSVLTDSGLDTTEVDREEFYREVVQDDGLLVLLLLDANGGRLQSAELAHQLWISKFPQNDDKTISTIAEDEAKLHEQLWKDSRPMLFFFKIILVLLLPRMSFFARAYHAIGHLDPTYDVDSSDRLKYVYTPWILCGTAFLVFAHEYVGAPIQCWAPRQWAGGWEQYAEQYCLVENTYFVRMNDSNLPVAQEREDREIRYYQWVPFVLLLQALFLYLPRFVWKQLQFLTKIDLPSVTVALRNEAKRMVDPLNVASIMKPARRGTWGCKLTISLLFTKVLSIAVVVCQVLFIGWFMGAGLLHGLRVVVDAVNGRQWQESGNFPRVTFCDLEVHELGGAVHRWSLQCVLMINMFNEKIFVFLWWWFCVLVFISILNLFRWLIRLSFDSQRSFITAVLESSINDDFDTREVSEFCKKTLKTDGVTIVRLIEENATIYQAAEFTIPLWKEFIQKSK